MNETGISWTAFTWNPWSGCTQVSPGCAHCYALTRAENFRGTKGFPNGFGLTYRWRKLDEPLKKKQPAMIFVNSMSDLYFEQVADDDIKRVFDVMNRASWHTFQVLTKRSHRLLGFSDKVTWTPNHLAGCQRRKPVLDKAARRFGGSAGKGQVCFRRAAARRGRFCSVARPRRLGHRRRRIRAGGSEDGRFLGAVDSGPVSKRGRGVLLQAVERASVRAEFDSGRCFVAGVPSMSDDSKALAKIQQSLSRLESRFGFGATMDKLIKIGRTRQEREARRAEQYWRQRAAHLERLLAKARSRMDHTTRAGWHVAETQDGDGYELSRQGYDFTTPGYLRAARKLFYTYLTDRLGCDPQKCAALVKQLKHAWEFSAVCHDNPTPDKAGAWCQYGKSFMSRHAPPQLALNPDPDSFAQKLYRQAQEVKKYNQEIESLIPHGLPYAKLFSQEVEDERQ
jgi:hypothetical protein